MDTNFWGAVRLTKRVLPIMRKQRGGVVLQVSSVGGRRGFAGNAAYHASKFALEGWTEAVSKEVEEGWGVRFCCVEPGGVKTGYAARSVASTDLTSGKGQRASEDVDDGEDEDETTSEEAKAAYANPGSQINVLRAMHEDPGVINSWADAETVVKALYSVVGSGDVPLRLPLGADSWAIQRAGLVGELEGLEKMKEVALGVSKDAEGQLRALEKLRV